jgi:hypothetical protein
MRRIIPIMVLAVLLAGCKVKVDQGFELNSDGSGKASVVFGFDDELIELMGSFAPGGDPLSELTTEMPPGWSSEDWSEGEFTGLQASTEFADLAGLRSVAALAFSGEDGLFETFLVEDTSGGGFRFEATMSGETLEESMQGFEGFDLEGSANELSETFFDAEIFVKLPGRVTSHNADRERSDGTLVWNVRLTDSGRMIQAESEPQGGLPLVPISVAVGIVLLTVAGVAVWKQRSSYRDADVESFVVAATSDGPAVDGDPFG